jgi:SAM-dependent methyltransferase
MSDFAGTMDRWKRAQTYEGRHRIRNEVDEKTLRENLKTESNDWKFFMDNTKFKLTDDSLLLDIGSAGIPVFMTQPKGIKYTIDPLIELRKKTLPVLDELYKEYSIKAYSMPLEDFKEHAQFDAIFVLNVLDHVGDLDRFISKLDSLLKKGGYLVIYVDMHTNPVTKWICNTFYVELPHPHHFVKRDIPRLFRKYKPLKYQDVKDRREGLRVKVKKRKAESLSYRMRQYIRGFDLGRFLGVSLMTVIYAIFSFEKVRVSGRFLFRK